MINEERNIFGRFWRSIFRGQVHTGTGHERKWTAFENLILHLHPRTLPEKTLNVTLTLGLGGMALMLVSLLALTGILLLFVYEPSPDKAYASIITLQDDLLFGQLIRNIHHWSGNILVIISFLHLLRVYFTGAFHTSRQFNWVIGMVLFYLVLFSNFTGYLLPWDQLAFWAITICTSIIEYIPVTGPWIQKLIRGGAEIGPTTLSIFYALHIALLPVLLFAVMPFHFWRVRKAGGVVIPRSPDEPEENKIEYISTIPNLVLREVVVALLLVAFVLMYSVLFNAPLEAEANPGMSPNPAKAPWYFLGVQELLLHFHPLFAAVIIPSFFIGMSFLLPYLKTDLQMPGVWFISVKGRQMRRVSAIAAFIFTSLSIVADEFLINLTSWLPGLPAGISNGLIPFILVIAGLYGFYAIMQKRYNASKAETMQALIIFIVVSFLIMTATGIWFRGEGMSLSWPWNVK
jgi:quinol-cytochrome oxidoreductase complex cytochrome b subunit